MGYAARANKRRKIDIPTLTVLTNYSTLVPLLQLFAEMQRRG